VRARRGMGETKEIGELLYADYRQADLRLRWFLVALAYGIVCAWHPSALRSVVLLNGRGAFFLTLIATVAVIGQFFDRRRYQKVYFHYLRNKRATPAAPSSAH
jgi:hypothetical protein